MHAEKSIAFQKLRPICSQLLQIKQDSKLLTRELMILHDVVVSTSKMGLQACRDYMLFPLFILLDAVVSCQGGWHAPLLEPKFVLSSSISLDCLKKPSSLQLASTCQCSKSQLPDRL